jgi:uncharacterized protein
MTEEQIKEIGLRERLASYGRVAVAFSGGVDSSYLCAIAAQVLNENAVAFTIVSPLLPASERDMARQVAKACHIRHVEIEEKIIPEEVSANPADRCYYCKKNNFELIKDASRALGIELILEGSNVDDLSDYRPGERAVRELGMKSPLRDCGLTKDDIRVLSKALGLPTWDKPSSACLASRLPYGERLEPEKLQRVEQAESYLKTLGFTQYRVRSHGDVARIEVIPEERKKLFNEKILDEVSRKLKSFGFLFVSMELEGYSLGSLNRSLS